MNAAKHPYGKKKEERQTTSSYNQYCGGVHQAGVTGVHTLLHLTLPRVADSEGLEGIFIDSRSRVPYTATLIHRYSATLHSLGVQDRYLFK